MRLHTREAGQGDAVVMLHGLFGSARNLATVQTKLSARHRVVAMDLRNHGASPHAWGMEYESLAADVAETLDAIGVAACAVVGHSMGGKVAMRLALDAPARVTRLVVADIAPVAYRGAFGEYAAAMAALPLVANVSRAQADAWLATLVRDAGVRAFLLQNLVTGAGGGWRIGLAEIAAGLPDVLDWPATARRYEGPTLFVGGERSDYVTVAHHEVIVAAFPNARFATVANAGHWLHADNPEGFLAVVEGFLKAADEPVR